MNATRFVSAVFAHLLVVSALVCCGSSHDSGVTNVQGPDRTTVVSGGKCLSRDSVCIANNDCCSEWCVNGICTRKSP
jgi:hypothetical protein